MRVLWAARGRGRVAPRAHRACHERRIRPVPLRESDVYVRDWLGLAALDKRGALRFHTCDGTHMQLSPACKDLIFGQYVGRPRSPGRWLAMNA